MVKVCFLMYIDCLVGLAVSVFDSRVEKNIYICKIFVSELGCYLCIQCMYLQKSISILSVNHDIIIALY